MDIGSDRDPIYAFLFVFWRKPIVGCGRFDEGLEKADQALAVSSEVGDRWCLPRTHEFRGRLLLQQTSRNADAAEQDLLAAVGVARSQCAKGSELRAATSLAHLWRDQGKSTQACDLLAPIYSWFTEGFDTLDLKEAKALLDELPCHTATSATRIRRDLSP